MLIGHCHHLMWTLQISNIVNLRKWKQNITNSVFFLACTYMIYKGRQESVDDVVGFHLFIRDPTLLLSCLRTSSCPLKRSHPGHKWRDPIQGINRDPIQGINEEIPSRALIKRSHPEHLYRDPIQGINEEIPSRALIQRSHPGH